jgi:anaerobic selenocysteine-containing dehydrogenase
MAKKLSRRDFLKVAAATGGTAAVVGGTKALFTSSHAKAAGAGQLTTSTQDVIVPGVCSLCASGCGILARVADGKVVKLEGNPMHPVNLGALCPKGQAAPELLYNPDRLTGPMKRKGTRGAGDWEKISWDEAAHIVADQLQAAREAGHPESVALMYGDTRGQLRSFFERFMQAVGSPNLVSKESLNTAAAKLGMFLTQGLYALPVYDLENANYILSFGANLLEAGWNPQRTISGWTFGRRGRSNRNKIVVIDPRQGVHGAKADEWIPINPGTDAALALGMAYVIIKSNLFDSQFVHDYGFGFDDFVGEGGKTRKGFKNWVLENYDPKKVEQITGVSATTIARLAGELASNKPAVAVLPGKGGLLNGGMGGVYAAMAIHMLNALIGAIEAPGGVLTQQYFPVTPYPDLPKDTVAEKGLKAERVDGAGTLFPLARHAYQAVAEQVLEGYPLEALFLYDCNPVFDAPGGTKFIQAFERIPLVVSFSAFMDESAQYADLVLPEPTFLERWQDDYIEGLGYPGIALRQPVIEPLYDTLNTADFLLKVTKSLGGEIAKAFPWDSYEQVLEFRLQEIGSDWEALKELGIWLTPGYRYAKRGSERWFDVVGRDRLRAPRDGYFDFYSRELFALLGKKNKGDLEKFGVTQSGDGAALPHPEPVTYAGDKTEFPFTLNVITLMSLGPKSEAANMPSLQEISGMTVRETWDSWLEMNPESARKLGLAENDRVEIESPFGRIRTQVKLVAGLHPDVVNLPFNQGHTAVGRFAKGRGVNGLEIMNPASEPLCGLAAFTNTRVKVRRV